MWSGPVLVWVAIEMIPSPSPTLLSSALNDLEWHLERGEFLRLFLIRSCLFLWAVYILQSEETSRGPTNHPTPRHLISRWLSLSLSPLIKPFACNSLNHYFSFVAAITMLPGKLSTTPKPPTPLVLLSVAVSVVVVLMG